jgi:hypothetical protein
MEPKRTVNSAPLSGFGLRLRIRQAAAAEGRGGRALKWSNPRLTRARQGMLADSSGSAQAIVDPKDAAESAGLRYVSDARPGIR